MIARPRLVTASGVTGIISATRATNLNGQTIQIGSVCELTPAIEGSEVTVAVKATLTELAPGTTAGYVEILVADRRVTTSVKGGAVLLSPRTDTEADTRVAFVMQPTVLGPDELADLAQPGAGRGPGEIAPAPSPGGAVPGPGDGDLTQVDIEAKFVEVPEVLLERLRFTATPVPESATHVVILSDGQFRSLLEQLEQTPGVDVMAAPRVSTLSGRQVQIQVVEVRSIVTGFHPVVPGSAGGSEALPGAAPLPKVEPVPLGTTLDIIPTVTLASNTIDLVVLASLKDILGKAEPEQPRTQVSSLEGGEPGVTLPLPIIRDRRLPARVTVPSGQTLLMLAGPAGVRIEEPAVIGASGTTRPPDRRLMVLITPAVVAPTPSSP
jgi:hypothetical protein